MIRTYAKYIVPVAIAALILSVAAPAFAFDSGTVYGTATLHVWAVTVSGTGASVESPLTYDSTTLGSTADERLLSRVTITNSGNQDGRVVISQAQAPQTAVGEDAWTLDDSFVTSNAAWKFFDEGAEHAAFVTESPATLHSNLAAGDSAQFFSQFKYPDSTGSLSDHFMRATITITDLVL